jgi:hypothetical protein
VSALPRAGRGARRYALAALVLLGGCASTEEYFRGAAAPPPGAERGLDELSWHEYWTGVVFNGEKIGFTRFALRRAPDAPGRYDVESEAGIRLRFLGADKRINLRSYDRVRADLTLESFRYENEMDGSAMTLAGRPVGDTLLFAVETAGARDERRLALSSPIYPLSVVALRPALRGLEVGRTDRYTVFNGETQELAEVEQEVLAYESSSLFEGYAYKVATRMLGVETTTWIAPDGRPLFELSLHGTMISALEDEAAAKRFLVEASLNKSEALLDFSLARSAPIERARALARLEIVLGGVPPEFAVPSEDGQSCVREAARTRCTIDRRAAFSREDDRARYLRPTLAAPSRQGDIVGLAHSIGGGASDPGEKLARILAWIDANIAKEAVDAFSASDVLRERRAECQGHSYLLAALARALGLPARVVNGLVYSEAHGGFLYHSWNEVWIEREGWRPVDATFGQRIADATHVKLIEGESAAELVPLVALLGRVRVEALSGMAHW